MALVTTDMLHRRMTLTLSLQGTVCKLSLYLRKLKRKSRLYTGVFLFIEVKLGFFCAVPTACGFVV